MKTKIFTTVVLLLLVMLVTGSNDETTSSSANNTIKILTTPETSGLVESWTSEYTKLNPGSNFKVDAVNLSEINSQINDENTLGFVLKGPDAQTTSELMWQMVVGRNVIVTVMNRENPFAETLNKEGVSAKELSALFQNGQAKTWNQLVASQQNEQVQIYIQDKPEVASSVSKFLEIDGSDISMAELKTAEELLNTIQNDKYAIGFCLLTDAADFSQNDFIANIKPLPIDKNNNGSLDYNENIYGSLESFERAVWIGKYPKSLIQNIYAVTSGNQKNESMTSFLSWVVTSGQQFIEANGYSDLVYSEMQSNLEKLNPVAPLAAIQAERSTNSKTLILVVLAILAAIIFASMFARDRKKSAKREIENKVPGILNAESIKVPGGVLFDKSHTWVFMEKDGQVKIGIDDFLQHVTGNITGIIMKEPGEKIAKNELIVTLIQEGKKIDIYSSVTGIIKEINDDLVTSPSLINSSPYSKGWIYSVEPTNWSREISFLKVAESYREWIKKEFIRLKDFIATISNRSETAGHLVYQEGGELHDHFLQQMGPKVWEDFQIKFIDNSDIN